MKPTGLDEHVDEEKVVNQILVNWELESKFTKDEVFRVEGILDVNTIEYFPCPKPSKHSARALRFRFQF